MPKPQQEAQGQADAFTSGPGAASGLPDQPTLHEFLTRLVSSTDARSAFEADPRAALDQAGLGEVTATEVAQASSLLLDYAPVEVVQEYDRSLHGSVETFAAGTQHVAINHLHPAHHEQEVTDLSMNMKAPQPDYSSGGDPDAQMPEGGDKHDHDVNIEQHDSQNLISLHHIGSDNNIGNVGAAGDSAENVAGTVGDVAFGSVDQVSNTVNNTVDTGADLAAGAGAGAPAVGELAGDLPLPAPSDLPVVGDVAGSLPLPGAEGGGAAGLPLPAPSDLPVVGDVAGSLPLPGAEGGGAAGLPVVGDVAGALPAPTDVPVVGDVAGNLPLPGAEGSGAPLDLPAPTDVPVVGDVAGALPAPTDVPVVGEVAGQLPVEDVAGALPAPSDLPIAGDVAAPVAEPVQDLAHEATSAPPLDGLF